MNDLKDRIKSLSERLEKALSALNLEDDRKALQKLETASSEPNFWDDQTEAQSVMQRSADLRSHLEQWDKISDEINSIAEMIEMTADSDHQMIHDIDENLRDLETKFEHQEFELLFAGGYDRNNAIISIHAGTGGTDAQDWAEILERMFLRFFEKNNFTSTILSQSDGEEAGIKSVSIEVKGLFAYGYLRSERGVHRLVRLSPFNSDHARQTSFALVEVIPEVEETEFKLDEKDLRIETFRASGHGGQSVNTTDSAVRITHLPTGLVATSQNERSQLQNKQLALKVLTSKIISQKDKEHAEDVAKLKGDNVSAEWGNQIRSYVLHPYTLVKDHRTGYEETNIQAILDGDIDMFIEAYLRKNIQK